LSGERGRERGGRWYGVEWEGYHVVVDGSLSCRERRKPRRSSEYRQPDERLRKQKVYTDMIWTGRVAFTTTLREEVETSRSFIATSEKTLSHEVSGLLELPEQDGPMLELSALGGGGNPNPPRF